MKEKKLLGIVLLILTLTACKSESLEEAIKKDIPFNVERVVYTEKVKDGVVVLYITEQETIEAMAVAFIKKDKKNRWENAGNNHWDYKENPNMTTYMNTFYDYDETGSLENRIPIIYGRIVNDKILTVQVAGETKQYEDAKIITSGGSEYFIKIGDYSMARGLDSAGEVIEEYIQKK